MEKTEFQELLWQKGRELYRNMPWRDDVRPYYILVSELMLQQTQVERVKPKFEAFIKRFPNEKSLAMSPLSDVLSLWSGLGYNRRAKFLHEAAKKLMNDFDGLFPETSSELKSLPGVGQNTAGAILAYAFNQPVVFIETNIRTVYFHHFFPGKDQVSDADIQPIIEATLDKEHPREFYWALMDYGAYLKSQQVGSIRASKHYKRQSKLEGSVRQVRGQIIKLLIEQDYVLKDLKEQYAGDERFTLALNGLLRDGLVNQINDRLYLTK
jgi:A/G-specific adenine glycosylase